MKCLEIITLRSATKPEKMAIRDLVKKMGAGDTEERAPALVLYRNASVGNDISVHLQRELGNGHPEKSPMGLQLARLFSEFGLVNHSVWIEE
ncbi:MAG: hypothetical protein SWQ30_01065 [Thermodesulfobacteriota bacterium]|nr:hypothetical protein [Thermodesulfobacteriota bacterium]